MGFETSGDYDSGQPADVPVHYETVARLYADGFFRPFVDVVGFKYEMTTDDREDLMQDTLLQSLYQPRIVEVVQAGSGRSYMHSVIRNTVINQWRAKRARPEGHVTDAASEVLNDPGASPDFLPVSQDATDYADNRMITDELLAGLSDVQGQVIALRYWTGLSDSEIAEHLELPLGTVKWHMRAALQSMRKEMRRRGIESEGDF